MAIIPLAICVIAYPASIVTAVSILQAVDPTAGGIDYAIAAGVPGVLGFIIVGFINEWIVPGRSYRRLQNRADRLEATLYKAAGVTEVLVKTLSENG